MAVILKSVEGIPAPDFPIPKGVVLADQARIARGRFYPVTFLFTAYSVSVLGPALVFHPVHALTFFSLGVVFWTLLEYLVHRYVLHGRFPDGPGVLKHRMHTFFDTMHGDHHRRPWDGMYINGYLDGILGTPIPPRPWPRAPRRPHPAAAMAGSRDPHPPRPPLEEAAAGPE